MKRRKWIAGAIIAAIIILIAAIVASRRLPEYAENALRKKLDEIPALDVRYGGLSAGLLSGLRLKNLSVEEKEQRNALCTVKTLDAKPDMILLLRGKLRMKRIVLVEPACTVTLACEKECVYPKPFGEDGQQVVDIDQLPRLRIINGSLKLEILRGGRSNAVLVRNLNGETFGGAGEVRGRFTLPELQTGEFVMRDAVAGFSLRDGKLHLKGFRGKVSDGTVSAVLTLDFSQKGIPYKLESTLRNVRTELAAKLLAVREELLRGRLTGTLKSEGTLSRLPASRWEAKLKIPSASIRMPLRFDEEKLKEKDYLVLNRVRVEFSGKGGNGHAALDASAANRRADFRLENSSLSLKDFINGRKQAGVDFDLVISGTIDRVKKITDGLTGFDIPFDGNMSTHFSLIGNSVRPDQLMAQGTVVFTNGFISQTISTERAEREKRKISYRKMKMGYEYKDSVFYAKEMEIQGDEIDFHASGYIRMKGKMNIRGEAKLSPALAARVLGWEHAENVAAEGKVIPAEFHLAGTTNFPLLAWRPAEGAPPVAAAAGESAETEPVDMEEKNVLEKVGGLFEKAF